MRRLLLIVLLLFGLLFSCKNFEIEHPDFDYTSGFFPYQFPVRTLVLGDYIYDNSNDNAHKFIISVAMGGVYENKTDRDFDIQVDESLCDGILFNADGDTIKALPRDYYTLSSDRQITIPGGEMDGGIEVQLSEAFFSDPDAIKLTYVLPVRLIGSADVDTILNGSTTDPDADIRMAAEWNVPPKNFTMFAVKYINEYEGVYFHYGQSSVKDVADAILEDTTYSERYVENNPTSKLLTTGRHQVSLRTHFRSDVIEGEIDLLLNFNGNACTVTAGEGTPYTVTGTGEFKADAYEWGNKPRNGIELNYTVSDGDMRYEATEVLVARDRGVVMEVYEPRLFEQVN